MSTQYLSFGVVDARDRSDQDPALLRTVELERAGQRRMSRFLGTRLRVQR